MGSAVFGRKVRGEKGEGVKTSKVHQIDGPGTGGGEWPRGSTELVTRRWEMGVWVDRREKTGE